MCSSVPIACCLPFEIREEWQVAVIVSALFCSNEARVLAASEPHAPDLLRTWAMGQSRCATASKWLYAVPAFLGTSFSYVYCTIRAKIAQAATSKTAVAITARVIITLNMDPPTQTRSKRSVWVLSAMTPNASKALIKGGGPQMKY